MALTVESEGRTAGSRDERMDDDEDGDFSFGSRPELHLQDAQLREAVGISALDDDRQITNIAGSEGRAQAARARFLPVLIGCASDPRAFEMGVCLSHLPAEQLRELLLDAQPDYYDD